MWKCQCAAACTYFRIICNIEYQHHFIMSRCRYEFRIHRNAIRTCEIATRVSVCVCDEQQSRAALNHFTLSSQSQRSIMMAVSIGLSIGLRTLVLVRACVAISMDSDDSDELPNAQTPFNMNLICKLATFSTCLCVNDFCVWNERDEAKNVKWMNYCKT